MAGARDSGPARQAARRMRGFRARLAGRRGEVISALWLMAKGYRILGFRLKTPQGEIDLLAQKGEVLAVVEVKLRTTIEAALEAVTVRQRERLRRAGESLARRRPSLAHAAVRLDLLALAPGRLPRHIPDAWQGS
ncbi:MAG: YraN family protein [Proteobacteria bacterium]|nr:YraN family protein [Pseudomonadota bacterium]